MLNRRSMTSGALAAACSALIAAPALAGAGIEALTTDRVASGLSFPVFATHAPGDFTRLYILEKPGRIKVLNTKTGALQTTTNAFLDINGIVGGGTTTNNEQGLLGLAFHPDWQSNRYYYVNYTNNSGNTVVARYTAADGDDGTDGTGSPMTIIGFNQPEGNHNGGWLGFGPNDGYLYISTGDGGGANDQHGAIGNSQDITNNKLGKLLRLDVDGGTPYAIPPTNPFVGITGDDEIWAYGLRNPWRCCFDRANGDLYIADVGQNAREELNYQRDGVPGGRNYGWRCMEALNCTGLSGCTCNAGSLTNPFHNYPRTAAGGTSVTGGYVYRGCNIPTLKGQYFFADWGSDNIWTVNAGGGTTNLTERSSELDPPANSIVNISSFGEDALGELYICEQTSGGEIWKIIPVTPTISDADFDCDGAVGFADLLELLAQWGPCDGCRVDIDGDHNASFTDLLDLLSKWG